MRALHLIGAGILAAAAAVAAASPQAGLASAPPEAQVDRLLARWTATTPGCAVAAAENGKTVLSKAYGMADLEHDIKNTPETIFEAGSVSKQFTAAAVLLLARDGKLSIDDPVKKYVPELPDFPPSPNARDASGSGAASGAPLLIRHMLNHTSGLRDWGSVEAIAGWPRTTRAYTHDHVLDIVSRQRALNFPPGTRWSYSNTGYNLAAIIVSRVSGMSFAEFSRTRLFEPLGMTSTSWRDDFTRVVKNRAIAYSDDRDGFHSDMPFENVHGNGGLLTTVGDLLKWNENFATPNVGDAAFVALQQTPGTFTDGRSHDYALGLMIRSYRGLREVSHSGSTAGYRAHLARYPDSKVSVAVLCNVSSGAATQYSTAIADLLLRDRLKTVPPPVATYTMNPAEGAALAGLYRSKTRVGTSMQITASPAGLRAGNMTLIPQTALRFVSASGATMVFDGRGGATMTDPFGRVDTMERVPAAKPTVAQLALLAGTYTSADAETTMIASVSGESLVLTRRPASTIRLTPVFDDGFSAAGLGTVVFHRNAAGRVVSFSVTQDRVWDLRFDKK